MTTPESEARKWLDDRLEAFVDGELPEAEFEQFRKICAVDDALRADVLLAKAISTELRSISDAECPPFVAAHVMAHVRKDIRIRTWAHIQNVFFGLNRTHFRPAVAVAVLFVVVMTASQLGRTSVSNDTAEVAEALNDVKWTLAYLSDMGRTTGSSVRSNVLEDELVEPMSRNFSTRKGN